MGATTWDYFAPYDENVESVLQRLREQTFRAGKYERFTASSEDLKPFQEIPGIVDSNAPMEQQMKKQAGENHFQWAVRIQNLANRLAGEKPKSEPNYSKKPTTIDELLEEQGESGTHSILDIDNVSDAPEFRKVSPMPISRLLKIFGTDKPTRKMIENKLGEIDLIENPLISERWQGIYFTVYRDDKPDEIFFMGTSGD